MIKVLLLLVGRHVFAVATPGPRSMLQAFKVQQPGLEVSPPSSKPYTLQRQLPLEMRPQDHSQSAVSGGA